MTFSFEPFLAISAGHFMAVSAGPEQNQIRTSFSRSKRNLGNWFSSVFSLCMIFMSLISSCFYQSIRFFSDTAFSQSFCYNTERA